MPLYLTDCVADLSDRVAGINGDQADLIDLLVDVLVASSFWRASTFIS
ncbi:MAG: hypothetical protein ABIS14_02185 [Sphingomonas sp.]